MQPMFRLILLLLLSLNAKTLLGQDYIAYQKVFNRVDTDIKQEKFSIALVRLDTINNRYNFVYARHCLKALQICAVIQDSSRATVWLRRAFLQGVPLWMIETNELTRQVLPYGNIKPVLNQYDSLRSKYYSSINRTLAKSIDSLLVIDQMLTEKVNNGFILSRAVNYNLKWKQNNQKSFEVITAIMKKYGYPGERLIGLPEDLQDTGAKKHFAYYGIMTVKDHRAYTMLIHYFSNKRKPIDSMLYKNILNGYLYAYQYGALQDFRSEYGGVDNYYNVWHTAKDKDYKIDEVNMRRAAIGLNSYAQQQQHRDIVRYRLKTKTISKEIMLE